MRKHLYLYTLVAALGGLLFGYDTAVINGAMPFFSAYFNLSEALQGWAVSSALIGCIAGAIFVGRPADIYGRRSMLRVMAALFLLSAIGTGLATSLPVFVLFRFIGGIAIGGASVLSPVYISEIAPPAYRGRLTITFQLAIVIGILLAFFSDYLLLGSGVNNWRWMFASEALPAIIFLVLLYNVARSPRWLVKSGNSEEALAVISKVNPGEDPAIIIASIKESLNSEIVNRSTSLIRKPYVKLVFIGIMVGMINQFTGINIVMYYATDIFREAGFSTDSAIGQTVIIGITNLLFTLVGMSLIDKIGRKVLLLAGSVGMSVFLAVFAASYFVENMGNFIPLVCLVGFVAFFAATQGSVIWVLLSEMFPNSIRSRGAAIGTFSHWFFNGLTAFLFPVISASFVNGKGTGYIFSFYAAATFLSFFFFRRYLAETKGKSLEEMGSDMHT